MKIEYHNIYTHLIITTQDRIPCITEINRERIEKYITGIVNNNDSRLYSIYVNPEHAHLLISQSPRISVQSIVSTIAVSSSKFINLNKLVKGNFNWQESAAAFSVSKSDVDRVCKYIREQPEHHKIKSFKEEMEELTKLYQQTLKQK